MSEVVGEGIVVIRTDESQVDTDGAGRRAGQGFSTGFGAVLKRLAGAAVVTAAAAGVSKAFTQALDFDAGGARLQASLGLNETQSAAAGAVAGRLYAENYGKGLSGVGGVQDAVGEVLGSIRGLREGSEAELAAASRAALGYADVFGVEVSEGIQGASRLINSGLAPDAEAAFDLLTRASQRVPAALRQDLFDATDEYSQFFSQIGLSGSQAFGALVTGADQGMFGIDKAGDAVKEFTIRSTDMSTASVAAYKTLGLSAEDMANAILQGGDVAAGATDQIIDRLLAIDSPAKQANTAIALFGTPLEDLGTRNIPQFLRGLQGTSGALGDVAGATDAAVTTMSDTPLVRLQGMWRSLQGAILDVATKALDPVLDSVDSLVDGGGRLVGYITGTLEPVLSGVGDDVATSVVPQVVGGVQDLVSGALPLLAEFGDGLVGTVLPAVVEVGGALVDNLLPAFSTATDVLVGQALPAVVSFAGYMLDRLGPVVTTVADVVANDLLPPVLAIAEYFYSTVIPAVISLVAVVADRLEPVFSTLVDVFVTKVLPTVQKVVGQIRDQLVPAMLPVLEKVGAVVGFLIRLAATILGVVLPPLIRFAGFLIENVVPAIVPIIAFVFRLIGGLLSFGGAIITAIGFIGRLAGALAGLVADGLGAVVDGVTSLPDRLLALGGLLLDAGKRVMGSFLDGLASAGDFVGGIAGNIWGFLKGLINDAITGINDALEFTIPIPGAPDITINPPNIPRLQYGTPNFAGGMAWVGEVGPELVALPQHSRVIPAKQSEALASEQRGGSGNVYVDKLVAHDYADFTRQTDDQRRLAAVGGRRPAA